MTVIGTAGGGAEMGVTFRAAAPVPISATEPALLVAADVRHQAALLRAPSQTRSDDSTATSVAYRLDAAGRAAVERAGNSARLLIHDGTRYRSYPVQRADLFE